MLASLRVRLWLTYVLIVTVVLIVISISLLIYLARNPFETRQELQRIRSIASLVLQRNEAAGLLVQPVNLSRLNELLSRSDSLLKVRLAVFGSDGALLADSRSGVGSLPDWRYFESRRGTAAPTFRDGKGKIWMYAIRQLDGGGYLLVTAPRPRPSILSVFGDEFVGPLFQAAIAALVLALLLAVWIAHWVAAPLQRMADAARAVADGQYHPIPAEGPGEVRALVQAFNDMTVKVQSSQQSQRDFVANVSHELKTPLTSIQGFSQAILDGAVDTPESLHQAAETIYTEAGRMHQMVMELLDLARLDAGILSMESMPFDLTGLLTSAANKLAPLAQQAGVTIRIECGDPLPVMGDPDRLAQVLTNLVDNALKYTPAGREIRLTGRRVGDQVEVSVADGGLGIPADDLQRIFERFYQSDKSRSGMARRGVGLGLAIAREIVLAHGGTIQAANLPSGGAVFTVRLPIARTGSAAVEKRRPQPTGRQA
jgi:signal transduction histidine kinase